VRRGKKSRNGKIRDYAESKGEKVSYGRKRKSRTHEFATKYLRRGVAVCAHRLTAPDAKQTQKCAAV